MRKIDWGLFGELRWVAVFAALSVATMLATELCINDLMRSEPARSQQALASMVSLAMLLGLVAALSAAVVFGPAQLLQAAVVPHGWYWSLAPLPLSALMTWFMFGRVLPLDINLGFNGLPAQPGGLPLGWEPYLTAFGFQAGVSGFSLGSRYLQRVERPQTRTVLLLGLALVAIVFGVIWGRVMAELHPPPVSSTP